MKKSSLRVLFYTKVLCTFSNTTFEKSRAIINLLQEIFFTVGKSHVNRLAKQIK